MPDPASLTGPVMDAHDLTPDAIFALLASLGGRPGRSLVVACEPADVSAGMGLSEPVRRPCRTRCGRWQRFCQRGRGQPGHDGR